MDEWCVDKYASGVHTDPHIINHRYLFIVVYTYIHIAIIIQDSRQIGQLCIYSVFLTLSPFIQGNLL